MQHVTAQLAKFVDLHVQQNFTLMKVQSTLRHRNLKTQLGLPCAMIRHENGGFKKAHQIGNANDRCLLRSENREHLNGFRVKPPFSNNSDIAWMEPKFDDFHVQQNIYTNEYDYPGFSLIGNKSVLCIVHFVNNVSNFHKDNLHHGKT